MVVNPLQLEQRVRQISQLVLERGEMACDIEATHKRVAEKAQKVECCEIA